MIENATSPQVDPPGADQDTVTLPPTSTTTVSLPRVTWTRRVVRVVLGSVCIVVAGYLGRTTVIGGHGLSLVWPAIGVAGVWIASGNRRTWPTDVIALIAAITIVTATTGADLPRVVIFLGTNLTQTAVFVGLTRRLTPNLWGLGGSAPLQRLTDLGRLTLSAGLSGIAGLTTGFLGAALLLGKVVDSGTLAVWWGRNTVALLVITVLAVLAGRPLAVAGSPRAALAALATALRPTSAPRAIEAAALLLGTGGVSYAIFSNTAGQPLAFLLLVTSVWAGLRFAPLTVTLHGVGMGICGIAYTLDGNGPFGAISSIYYRAVIAQSFVAITVLTGLALAFSRLERDAVAVELVAARRAADERAQLLDAVLDSMNEGIVVVEEGGEVLVRNAAGRQLLGLEGEPHEFVQPASAYGLFRTDGQPMPRDALPATRSLAGEVVEPEDFQVRAPSVPHGRVVAIGSHPLPKVHPDAPARAMVNIRDVTLDRQHRDSLASFAGVVAHDLFSPLSIVDGWTEALTEEFALGPVSPAVGTAIVGRIHAAATHMRVFIGDLLSYTVARDQSLRRGAVDLTALARSLAGLRTDGPQAPLIVVEDGLQVWADPGLVRQLLDNLIGNAVKYVAPGVRPTVEISGATRGDWLEVSVTDNGIGIPEEQREAVFETFHRAHSGDFAGTGLGLAICRRIVDRHGGTIEVTAAPRGSGSTFVLTLPILVRNLEPISSEASGLPVLTPFGP